MICVHLISLKAPCEACEKDHKIWRQVPKDTLGKPLSYPILLPSDE